jgi:predicted ArsR family transcriptional regulator
MRTLQEQARALGDPTRHDVFRYVAERRRPVDVAELTDHFRLNHNAIRQHLAKLVAAGLLVERKAKSSGRGRPRLCFEVDPNADSRWGVSGPYERLSLLLAEVVRTGASPAEVGRRAGATAAAEASALGAGDLADRFVDELTRQGFEPTARRRGDNLDVTLRSCPFATTASADPDTVCELHAGIAEGIADTIGGVTVAELVAVDPVRGHCQLHCVVGDADGPTEPERRPVHIDVSRVVRT